jgi:beta-glucosidase
MMGIGYTGMSANFVKPIDGIRNKVASGTQVIYARGSGILESDNPEKSFAEAAEAAKKAHVAILFLGTDQLLEGEGRDRSFINLPPIQQQLLRGVLAANPRTVVVLVNGGPLSLSGGGGGGRGGQPVEAPAVVEMFMAGEESGNAVAEVLFGDYNPGGKLPYTVYESAADLPPMSEYDITKGFTYMYFRGRPAYPFGHGLSYTTFGYGGVTVAPDRIPASGQVTIRADVQNTGKRAGDEVVQLYIRDVEASVRRPALELRGFERISLKSGERRTVSFTVPAEKLAFYDVGKKAFVAEPGVFEVLVGSSSADIRAKGQFELTAR